MEWRMGGGQNEGRRKIRRRLKIRKKAKRAIQSNQIGKDLGKMKHRRGRNRIFEELDESMEVIDDDEEDDDFPYI